MSCKRQNGRYYTLNSPFSLPAFRQWAAQIGLPKATILEPYAGSNNLIYMLQRLNLCRDFVSYDIRPGAGEVRERDTIRDFPKGFEVCVTNPPWLARNSATRRGLAFPSSRFDDLYKHCLELCLLNCRHVAAIIPATFLQSGLFRSRLQSYVLLHDVMFADTENPVCLALFGQTGHKTQIHYDRRHIGDLPALEKHLPQPKGRKDIRFNAPEGKLGFISFDGTSAPSIRFCDAKEISGYAIKVSSRFITRIDGNFGDLPALIRRLNRAVGNFRRNTQDVFLTPFKGLRKDGRYRRRMDFMLARRLIEAAEHKAAGAGDELHPRRQNPR